ncbi:MAG TPA: hypothetical protein VE093_01965 [Polyangiaceae bacterium]|jgi:hypothetical protein|nr:hypothetical protein [Polyangiaceae bacterium]
MSDVSKMVADRTAVARTVLSSIEVHGAEISADLTAILFPGGPPNPLTVKAFVSALHDALAASVKDLCDADLAHAQELADDDAPRAARDAAVAQLRDQVIGLRGTLSSVYGPAILKAYGLAGETPEDPNLLLHRAENTAALLASKPITEKPKQDGVTLDISKLVAALNAKSKELKDALDAVKREERQGQLTRSRRDQASNTVSARYQGVADAMTGLYELTGRADLADLVRPTARRRAGLVEEADVNAGGECATPRATPAASEPA